MNSVTDTQFTLTPQDMQCVRSYVMSLPAATRFRAPWRQDPTELQHTAIKPSMRAFKAALHDACRARLCRRQAKRASSQWQRARLIQTALQCEARVRYAADMAMRAAA
jgi:hypothetical protein